MNQQRHGKSHVIKANIEATIKNAIETNAELNTTSDPKKQQELLSKNAGRAQAIPSLIRDMKKAEALDELSPEDNSGDLHPLERV